MESWETLFTPFHLPILWILVRWGAKSKGKYKHVYQCVSGNIHKLFSFTPDMGNLKMRSNLIFQINYKSHRKEKCLIMNTAINRLEEWGVCPWIFNLSITVDECQCSEINFLTILPQRYSALGTHRTDCCVGPTDDLDVMEKGNKCLSLLVIKTYFFNYPTCSLVSIHTALSLGEKILHATYKITLCEKFVTGHLRNIHN